ncbi:helix-turn-helix domain-containing protein [Tautonia rosea]|uniref:helix-turn-helix domain-containing protein n=1 Tax=Tautonia rosea TaxID=2728037 RepID=UPI001473DCE5|nr:helix-turn-helix domain-containing protein [Tautonia rosea]
MSRPNRSDANKRRWFWRQWMSLLHGLADVDMRDLNRSEMVVYLALLRDTKPDGTARAGLSDLATRGGMSRSSTIRAVQSLVDQGKITIVKPGVPGKATLYTLLPLDAFRKLNPVAARWIDGEE